MDFALNDDQAMLRDSLRRFLDNQPRREDAQLLNGRPSPSRSLWRELGDLGMLLVGQPATYGGIGGAVEIAVVAEELGRTARTEPFTAVTVLAAQIIAATGRTDQVAEMLPAIGSGELILSVAHRDVGRETTALRRPDGGYRLDGHKALAMAGPAADGFLVTARIAPDCLGCFLLDGTASSITLVPTPLTDGSWACDVVLEKVDLPQSALLGDGDAEQAFVQALRYETLAACAELVGLMEGAMASAVTYAGTRQQFGQPIGRFQALRHKLADMAIDIEMTRAALNILIASFQDPDGYDPEQNAALARVAAVEAALRVCGDAIQIHGGMGMTEECGVGRHFARANVISALLGPGYRSLATFSDLGSSKPDAA